MQAVTPMLDIADLVSEAGGESLHACMQCATCTAVCPWNLVKSFSPRLLIRQVSLGFEGYEAEALWNCVTCNTCVSRCPRGVEIIDVFRSVRAAMIWAGSTPPSYRAPLGSLHGEGNPWQGKREARAAWNEELALPAFSPEKEFFFFTCCTQVYDSRNKKTARALAKLLELAGVSYGVAGEELVCCGDQARKAGAEDVFQALASRNQKVLSDARAKKILAASPHCMNVLNKDFGNTKIFVAEHYTVLLDRLVRDGRIVPRTPIERRVTYHDPCYLGRHNGIYDEPRRVLSSIPGLNLVEMPRHRENSLCCGGGGGGLWSDRPLEQRFAVLRVREALKIEAEVIATACPYCLLMLEDAVRTLDLEDKLEIKDIAEFLADSTTR